VAGRAKWFISQYEAMDFSCARREAQQENFAALECWNACPIDRRSQLAFFCEG
jgi:hypothetical protein